MKNEIRTRIVSALIAVGILFGLYSVWGGIGVAAGGVILNFLAIWEWVVLSAQIGPPAPLRLKQVRFVLLALAMLGIFLTPIREHIFILSSIFLVIVCLEFLASYRMPNTEKLFVGLSTQILGLVYCTLGMGLLLKLTQLPHGDFWVFYCLSLVFFGDIGAFFGGRAVGTQKLAPHLSPKKTVAGAALGLITTLITGFIFVFLVGPQLWPNLTAGEVYKAVILLFPVGVLSQCGDLFVSLLKRVANAKDAGQIMPGHGGVLDRLDGVYFAAPVIFMIVSRS